MTNDSSVGVFVKFVRLTLWSAQEDICIVCGRVHVCYVCAVYAVFSPEIISGMLSMYIRTYMHHHMRTHTYNASQTACSFSFGQEHDLY